MEASMPVNLSIKEVPDAIADRLRARAERNHRSLQGELMAIVEQAAREEPPARPALQTYAATGKKTIEQIAAEHRALYPEPLTQFPRAVDIVRADRDSR
jgi:plasmid stability protein